MQNGKPSPDIYLKTAQFLGVDPKKCLVLEDAGADKVFVSLSEILTARKKEVYL